MRDVRPGTWEVQAVATQDILKGEPLLMRCNESNSTSSATALCKLLPPACPLEDGQSLPLVFLLNMTSMSGAEWRDLVCGLSVASVDDAFGKQKK